MIYRSNPKKNYTKIKNEIFNSGLSLEAIAILCFVLSKPENFKVHKSSFHFLVRSGRKKVFRAFNELKTFGYMKSLCTQKNGNKFEYFHDFYDTPQTSEIPTKYGDFLKSSYWKNVKKEVLKRDKNTCSECGSNKYLHVHHLSYSHHFEEHLHLEDLITLCKSCHEKTHKINTI